MNSLLQNIKIALAILILNISAIASQHEKTTSSSSSHSVSHWSYEGATGPSHWGNLKQNYSECKKGTRQSPVNIRTHNAKSSKRLKDIFVSYGNVKLNIINNGHTIQVNSDGSSKALLGGKEYKLLQFHFHSSSEHTIDGKYYPMEAHLVHQARDGKLAVIAVMIDIGRHNSFIQKIFKFMPRHANSKTTNKHTVNANDILPKDRSYYSYTGSLTTPPCSQIVSWYVLKNPITISQKQLDKFHSIYKENFRPIQNMNSRKLFSK